MVDETFFIQLNKNPCNSFWLFHHKINKKWKQKSILSLNHHFYSIILRPHWSYLRISLPDLLPVKNHQLMPVLKTEFWNRCLFGLRFVISDKLAFYLSDANGHFIYQALSFWRVFNVPLGLGHHWQERLDLGRWWRTSMRFLKLALRVSFW